MKLTWQILLVASCMSQLPAQDLPASTAAIVDTRYDNRRFGIRATPGQVITITLGGFAPKRPYDYVFRAKAPVGNAANPFEGFDANIEMVSVGQESRSISAPILMVEQLDNCNHSTGNSISACWVTSITLQIPWEITSFRMGAPEPHWVTLVVSDGVSVARSAIQAFISNIHILNLCDAASQLYRDDASFAACTFDVRTNDGQLVQRPSSRVKATNPGDTVTIRAYGLFGLPQQPPELNGVRPTEAIPITQQQYMIEYRWGSTDLGAPATETTGTLAPDSVELAAGEVGLYLVRFRIPIAPPNLAACDATSGTNFALTLRGSESSDTARICVSPE